MNEVIFSTIKLYYKRFHSGLESTRIMVTSDKNICSNSMHMEYIFLPELHLSKESLSCRQSSCFWTPRPLPHRCTPMRRRRSWRSRPWNCCRDLETFSLFNSHQQPHQVILHYHFHHPLTSVGLVGFKGASSFLRARLTFESRSHVPSCHSDGHTFDNDQAILVMRHCNDFNNAIIAAFWGAEVHQSKATVRRYRGFNK